MTFPSKSKSKYLVKLNPTLFLWIDEAILPKNTCKLQIQNHSSHAQRYIYLELWTYLSESKNAYKTKALHNCKSTAII